MRIIFVSLSCVTMSLFALEQEVMPSLKEEVYEARRDKKLSEQYLRELVSKAREVKVAHSGNLPLWYVEALQDYSVLRVQDSQEGREALSFVKKHYSSLSPEKLVKELFFVSFPLFQDSIVKQEVIDPVDAKAYILLAEDIIAHPEKFEATHEIEKYYATQIGLAQLYSVMPDPNPNLSRARKLYEDALSKADSNSFVLELKPEISLWFAGLLADKLGEYRRAIDLYEEVIHDRSADSDQQDEAKFHEALLMSTSGKKIKKRDRVIELLRDVMTSSHSSYRRIRARYHLAVELYERGQGGDKKEAIKLYESLHNHLSELEPVLHDIMIHDLLTTYWEEGSQYNGDILKLSSDVLKMNLSGPSALAFTKYYRALALINGKARLKNRDEAILLLREAQDYYQNEDDANGEEMLSDIQVALDFIGSSKNSVLTPKVLERLMNTSELEDIVKEEQKSLEEQKTSHDASEAVASSAAELLKAAPPAISAMRKSLRRDSLAVLKRQAEQINREVVSYDPGEGDLTITYAPSKGMSQARMSFLIDEDQLRALASKKMFVEFPYASRVKRWFDARDLLQENLKRENRLQDYSIESIALHAFPRTVDWLVPILGRSGRVESQEEGSWTSVLPATITLPNGKTRRGKIVYAFNKDGRVYHRFFHNEREIAMRPQLSAH